MTLIKERQSTHLTVVKVPTYRGSLQSFMKLLAFTQTSNFIYKTLDIQFPSERKRNSNDLPCKHCQRFMEMPHLINRPEEKVVSPIVYRDVLVLQVITVLQWLTNLLYKALS